ncbi:MAG: iron-containing alcohol dehydrogenase family protein [Clostridiales bacterium]|nr:iron-containing alcohol dehydrogenase family protein [Clostridiales bacterium]
MKLSNYDFNLPSYSIGNEVYSHIDKICSPYGKKILVIGGKRAIKAAKNKIEAAIKNSSLEIIGYELFGKECTYQNVDRLRKLKEYNNADIIFGVGGGKALDTCKCLCIEAGKPLFTFPTVASNCAACTSVSVMYNEDGTFLKPHFYLNPAIHAFIDTEIIAEAPSKYMWAGIGDTYAKYYEATISSRGESLQHFTALGVTLSQMCLNPLVEYGKKAWEDNKNNTCSYEIEQVALAIIVTTAIVSIFLTRDFTPDYNSGLAHAIFYALTKYKVIEEKHLHGEVVAFGVLLALLCDNNIAEFEKIYNFNKELMLPTSLDDIDISKEEFEDIMDIIPSMSDVKHYPYKITKKMLIDSINYLEKQKNSKKNK